MEEGDGEPTRTGEGDLEASRVSGRRPKLERSRVEEADMEETTYSTLLPLNSTLLSASVPAPPPPPPIQSAPSTSSRVRGVPRNEPAPPQDTSTASSTSFCTAIMEARDRICNNTAPQPGRHLIKQGHI